MSLLQTVRHLLTRKRTPSNKERNRVAGGSSTQTANVESQNHPSTSLAQAPDSIPKAPIRTLPIEVLGLIFATCLPDLTSEHYERHSWTSIPSFNISWVCRDWRTIALGTPLLWTILADIDLTRSRYTPTPSYLQFIGELLHRSGDMDLTIFIYAPGVYESEAIKHPVINFILQSRKRWSALIFHSGIPVINLFCDGGHKNTFPRLRKLGLNMCIRPPHMNIIGFANAPLLEDVSVSGLFPDQLLLPYERLKAYREGSFSHSIDSVPAFLGNVLAFSKRLERLEILGVNYSIPRIPNPPRNIKVLHLRLDSIRSPVSLGDTVLDVLNLPFLEELKFRGMYVKDNAIVENLLCRSIMPNQQLPLRILYLRTALHTPSAGDLWRVLQMTPFLQELSIDISHIGDMIRLIENMAPSGCLSRLRRMALHLEQKNIKDQWISTLDDLTTKFGVPLPGEAIGNQCRELQLIFPNRLEARYVQDMFNSWNTIRLDSLQNADLERLEGWRSKLHNMLPNANDESSAVYWNSRKDLITPSLGRRHDIRFVSRLERLFKEIEDFELISIKCPCLYFSRLLYSLRRLSELKVTASSPFISREKQHKWLRQSKQLLGKWEPILLHNLAEEEKDRWVCKGIRSLLFIPRNHALRRSPQAVDLIYGLSEDSEDRNLLWPARR